MWLLSHSQPITKFSSLDSYYYCQGYAYKIYFCRYLFLNHIYMLPVNGRRQIHHFSILGSQTNKGAHTSFLPNWES